MIQHTTLSLDNMLAVRTIPLFTVSHSSLFPSTITTPKQGYITNHYHRLRRLNHDQDPIRVLQDLLEEEEADGFLLFEKVLQLQ